MKAAKAMKRAWEIAKKAMEAYGGKSSDYIAEALRIAWKEIKTPKKVVDRIKELEALGFKRWTKNGMDRLYINPGALGLNYTKYKTGNVSEAWFKGDKISNCECRRMLSAKTYIDIKTEKIYSDNATLKSAAEELARL